MRPLALDEHWFDLFSGYGGVIATTMGVVTMIVTTNHSNKKEKSFASVLIFRLSCHRCAAITIKPADGL